MTHAQIMAPNALRLHRRMLAAALAGTMALAFSGIAVTPAFAAGSTDGQGNGVQSQELGKDGSKTVDYQAFDSGENAWGDSNNESADAGDWYQDGKVHLFYDTTGGNWDEPGEDPANPDDNVTHPNGTFVVTVPTKIAYDGMRAGIVSTSDDYTVNVRGLIAPDKSVTVSAESGNGLANGSQTGDITETTTQGKVTWSAEETYGTVDGQPTTETNPDGSLLGTNTTDNIKMTGTARTAGTYSGAVAYSAKLS